MEERKGELSIGEEGKKGEETGGEGREVRRQKNRDRGEENQQKFAF